MVELTELTHILNSYLEQRKHLSLNSLAQNMKIPETSLRRIKNSDLKRMPKNETILKVLSYIFKTSDLYEIRSNLDPSGLGKYISEEFLLSDSRQTSNIQIIDDSVSDQTSYLVFKLASNSCGTTVEEIKRLFGEVGLKSLEKLELDNLIRISGELVESKIDTFKVSNKYFVRNFKAVSDFIKVDSQEDTPNLYYNLSESVNTEALSRIHKIQKKALKEIISIINDDESRGELPLFVLSAIDTLK